MTSSFTALILVILAFLGPVKLTLAPGSQVTAYDDAHRSADNPDGGYAAVAKVRCIQGSPELVFTIGALVDPIAVAHELLHAVDCADNGVFDGSPDPTRCAEVPGDCAHSWVYWALRHPTEAATLLGNMPRPGVAQSLTSPLP